MFRICLAFVVLFLLECPIWAGKKPAQAISLTIATANLSDNTSQAYEEAGIRILQSLQPDILALQEFNFRMGTAEDLAREIFGPDFYYFREKGGSRLPNGIISRYPIVDAGQWDDPYVQNRRFVWASIAVPGVLRPLHVICVHLVQNRAERRTPQARLLMDLIRQHFPPQDYVVLCGDLNVASRDSLALAEITSWFRDDWQPADQTGNKNTNAGRNRPYDFVLPNPALARHEIPTVLADVVFPHGMVFDSRLWNPPPPPVEWDDSMRNLQHLPVMKTFRLPVMD